MKIRKLPVLICFVLQFKSVKSQDSLGIAKQDNLMKPMFYAMVPKIVDVNCNFIPTYRFELENEDENKYRYQNEVINSINIQFPLIVDKKWWFVSLLGRYSNYFYEKEQQENIQRENYSVYKYGVRVVKQFDFVNKKWLLNKSLQTTGSDFASSKNISFYAALSTILSLRNSSSLMLGFVVIADKEVVFPALPLVTYTAWISKPKGLLFTGKFPLLEISMAKIFNNNTFLKGGINLVNHGHYISFNDYQFLEQTDEYKLKKIQLALNTRFEKAFYKSIWVGGELGYAFNYRTSINKHQTIVESDQSFVPNNFYFNIGLFIRPVTSKNK